MSEWPCRRGGDNHRILTGRPCLIGEFTMELRMLINEEQFTGRYRTTVTWVIMTHGVRPHLADIRSLAGISCSLIKDVLALGVSPWFLWERSSNESCCELFVVVSAGGGEDSMTRCCLTVVIARLQEYFLMKWDCPSSGIK